MTKCVSIAQPKTSGRLQQIALTALTPSRYQPRTEFPDEGLEMLAQTIRSVGILEPLLVRHQEQGNYQIIAGERRYRAAKLAGLTEVPCLVVNYTDVQAAQAALIENMAREELNPIAKASAMARMIDEFGYTHESLGQALGIARSNISNLLRLLKLDPRIIHWMKQGHLSEGHGKLLAGVAYDDQYLLAHRAIRQHWSIRLLQEYIVSLDKPNAVKPKAESFAFAEIEQKLSDKLGAQVLVKINPKTEAGYFKIKFKGTKTMQHLIEALEKNEN